MPSNSSQSFYKVMIFLILGSLTILSACSLPPKQKIENDRENRYQLSNLLRLNDMNEQAFAYHQVCLIKAEPMNEQFIENFEIVSHQLFDQCRKTLKWEPEKIVSQLMERRKYLQNQSTANLSTKGCHSNEALASQKHYRAMSQDKIDSIKP